MKKSKLQKKKVFVGLSGGVDSAVSAALLKKESCDVTGVFIKAWTPFDSAQGKPKYPCTWREDRRSAMRVAAVLDIPFVTLDLEKEYKKEVVDYMIREYREGRTPNPDVMCNKEIKFGRFLKFALEKGADYVATGHYARRYDYPSGRQFVEAGFAKQLGAETICLPRGEEGEVVLAEGADKNKDQSYFLWTLTHEQLKHILFPIGHLQKPEVRELADKFRLPQAKRKDSQGLCFLGQIDMKEFLKEFVGAEKGKVLSEKGEVIGEHEGAALYTIGERHGFNVFSKSENENPLYVVEKNIVANTITVASKNEKIQNKFDLREVELKDVNLLAKLPKNLLCRVRYRQEKIPCEVLESGGKFKIKFKEPQSGVSAGQSLVLYDGEACLGGGIIPAKEPHDLLPDLFSDLQIKNDSRHYHVKKKDSESNKNSKYLPHPPHGLTSEFDCRIGACYNQGMHNPYVIKATGEREEFDPAKLHRSLTNAHASPETADKIVEEIEKNLKEGDSTKEIYKHAFRLLKKEEKPAAAKYSLRRAIMELGPTGFPFEQFVAEIFRARGYETTTDFIAQGECAEHEIDITAWNKEKLVFIETKFHNELGLKSDLKVALYIKARWEDLENLEFGIEQICPGSADIWGGKKKMDEGWLITNTKFSESAIKYAKCRKMNLVGWNYPENGNLQDLIEESHLHPITCLESITPSDEKLLMESGIVLCKQAKENPDVVRQAGFSDEKISEMLGEINLIQQM